MTGFAYGAGVDAPGAVGQVDQAIKVGKSHT
jgi:hypothetical protein